MQKIRVQTIIGPDLLGEGVLHDIAHLFKNAKFEKVETAKVYRLEGINEKDAKVLAEKVFCEDIYQTYTLNESILGARGPVGGFPRPMSSVGKLPAGTRRGAPTFATPRSSYPIVVEIAYKPGVMNPEVASILKAASDLGIKLVAADSSHEYGFFGNVKHQEVEKIVKDLHLLNDMVEHIVREEPKTLVIKGTPGKTQTIPIGKMSDSQLMELSKDKLFLNLEEMKVIQNYFAKIKRDPTDCELEALAQTWSEHSGHKTFKAKLIVDGKEKEPLIKRLKDEALKHGRHTVSAFVDNAGVMDFYEGWAINGKAETHNAPSAIEPYGGTMTGNGGVFRDVVATGQGAKTLMSSDIFCLAPPDMPKEKLPQGTLPPDYMLKRVVAAVRDYDNRVGIPTNNGSFHFHDDFRAKPVVLAGAYGILPKAKAKIGRPKVGDIAVVIGGRTGRDGIHGATFSSGEMTERTVTINATAVQIGNAIEEKRTFDVILEARDKNLIRAIQDVGGGGLSSAIGEVGSETGVTVYLDKAPLKYQGLAPWEIWISESQERMLLVIDPKDEKKLMQICKKYNVEATALGKFDGSKRLNIFYGKEKVCDLEMNFLHNGLPQRVMRARGPAGSFPRPMSSPAFGGAAGTRRGSPAPVTPRSEKEWINVLEKVVAHGNVNSKESILRLYDHTVQGTNAMSPFLGEGMDGPGDAAVVRPLLDKPYGVVISHGLNPILNRIDPYWGSIWAATEAIANYVAVGGNYKEASLINNFIWPFPDEQHLWTLDRSVDAVVDFMKTLQIPVISGKDSLSATYRGKGGFVLHIPPTLVMSVFGRIPDVTKTVSSDFKKVGSTIVFVGKPDWEAMSGSVYFQCHPERSEGSLANARFSDKLRDSSAMPQNDNLTVPKVDLKLLPKILDTIYKAIQTGEVLSVHDVSEGGLITAIFEMCVGGNVGALLRSDLDIRSDLLLLNETAGSFVVEVEDEKTAVQLFKGVPHTILGKTSREAGSRSARQKITVTNLFSVEVAQLQNAWQQPMREIFS